MKQYGEKFIDEFSKAELEKLAKQGQLIDVRTEEEYALGHINGSILHPVDEIESFNKEKNKTYYVICRSQGNRSANASKYLAKQGYNVINLDGGYKAYEENDSYDTQEEEYKSIEIKADRKQFNYRGFQCPGPIVKISQEMKNIEVGDQIEVKVTDPGFPSDIKSWVKQTRHTLVKLDENNNGINAIIQKEKAKDLDINYSAKGTTIVLFSGELDKAVAALIIANGARAAGKDVTIFFTFWGLNALKKVQTVNVKKQGIAKMFDLMYKEYTNASFQNEYVWFRKYDDALRNEKKNVDSLPTLINQAIEQNIKLIACTMSMDVMGIQKEELRDEVEYGGVGTYIGATENANHNLFI
ncbi:persulfide response sulfurtransferase CstA [Staphylococcus aureus]